MEIMRKGLSSSVKVYFLVLLAIVLLVATSCKKSPGEGPSKEVKQQDASTSKDEGGKASTDVAKMVPLNIERRTSKNHLAGRARRF